MTARGRPARSARRGTHTPDLLAEAGIEYVLDRSADELPFEMQVQRGHLWSLPYTRELNDMPAVYRRAHTAREFHDMICDQVDVLRKEGERVMTISLHPFVSGHTFRAKWINDALAHVMEADVWSVTGSELLDEVIRRENAKQRMVTPRDRTQRS